MGDTFIHVKQAIRKPETVTLEEFESLKLFLNDPLKKESIYKYNMVTTAIDGEIIHSSWLYRISRSRCV